MIGQRGFVRIDFSGPGGTCQGAKMLGLTPVGVEYDAAAAATARAAGHKVWQADLMSAEVRDYPWPAIWLYSASPSCFVAGTPVLTKRGAVYIEDVQVGDEVWTHRNRWRRVTNTMNRSAETVENGVITSTADHLFYSRRQVRFADSRREMQERGLTGELWSVSGREEWTPAGELQGALTATPLSVTDVEGTWECDPWLAGRYVADGWVRLDGTPRQGTVSIAVGWGKVDAFREEVPGFRRCWARTCAKFERQDLPLARWLGSNFGRGAANKTFPSWILAAPEPERRRFLDGYMAGDGCVIPGGHAATTVSRRLAAMIYMLGVSLGYTVSIIRNDAEPTTVIEGRTVSQLPWYRVSIKDNDGRYTRDLDGHRWAKIRKAPVSSGVRQVYDITVEEDHSFVAWGKVVHNCQTFSMAGKGAGRGHMESMFLALRKVADGALPEDALRSVSDKALDGRTELSLEPMNVIRDHRPANIVFEQVPTVLPLWEQYAEILREWGYSVWTGTLSSETFGVPQTRKRAVLMASLEREVAPPTPTHSRYYSHNPTKLDDGVAPWVSMAQALDGAATMRSNYGTGGDPALRGEREASRPAPTMTSKAGRNKWLRGNQKPGGGDSYQERSTSVPAQTVTSLAGRYHWLPTAGNESTEPEDMEWSSRRPSPTVVGSFKPEVIAAPKYRKPGDGPRQAAKGFIRVTVQEAGILQSFPASYPWQGSKGKQFEQVGNAWPPLFAAAVIAALVGP